MNRSRYIANRIRQHLYAAVATCSGIAGLLVLQATIDLEILHWWAALPLLALLGVTGTLSLAACAWYGMAADRQLRHNNNPTNRKKPAEAGQKENYHTQYTTIGNGGQAGNGTET